MQITTPLLATPSAAPSAVSYHPHTSTTQQLNGAEQNPPSLLVLMYHRANSGRLGNSPAMLEAHFAHIAEYCHCVLPGEALEPGLNVCLSFDDAYFDFYSVVFPLLKKFLLRALLAVPPGLILEHSNLPSSIRVRLTDQVMNPHEVSGGLCTWSELSELAESDRVGFAAHGMTHVRLDDGGVNLEREIILPGLFLSERLGVKVNSFVLPYGRYSMQALKMAHAHYPHVFRIGQALNTGWHAPLLYRVNADEMAGPNTLFSPLLLRRYRTRAWWNRLRGR